MSSVEVPCPRCAGAGYIHPPPAGAAWLRCAACDGIGRAWAPGAPGYGCTMTLGERVRGEVVTLGNGDYGRVLWHSPSGRPTTYLSLIGEFDGIEDHRPVSYPSCVGVQSVSVPRMAGDTNAHANSRSPDLGDPMQRRIFYSEMKGA